MPDVPVIVKKLQTDATTGNGQAVQLNGEARELAFYITGAGTVSTGAITLEEAATSDYAGTWSPLTSAVTITAACQVVHVSGAFAAVRARISTNVTGASGLVNVLLVGN